MYGREFDDSPAGLPDVFAEQIGNSDLHIAAEGPQRTHDELTVLVRLDLVGKVAKCGIAKGPAPRGIRFHVDALHV